MEVMGSEPAAHALVLQVGVKPFREYFVLGGVTDEARAELNRLIEQGRQILNV